MAQHDGLHDEGVGDKLKDAARTVKDKLAGKSNDDSIRDDSLFADAPREDSLRADSVQDESLRGDYARGNVRDDDSDRRLTRSEEELAVGTRRTAAGEVRVHKSVETEHVRQEVPVMREEVVIERHAVADGMRADDADFGEQEITIPVTEEEVVAEKRAVAKEEILVHKREVQETKTVEADLRQERVDVDDQTESKSTKGSRSKSSSRSTKRGDDSGRTGR
ncbi:MAG: YsnF/AvaK domain-containing protein [Gemmatimonadota bacterium]